MRNINNIKIIGIDHGYGNIKTANTVTPTGVTAYDTEPVFSGNILQYGGKYYRLGEGHKPFAADKCEDEDYYVCTLMGIARELHRENIYEADVHIAAGLPLTWVKAQREKFREYLLQNSEVEFVFNKKRFKVRVVGCSIFPQGYAAVLDKIGEMRGINMLADIGNGTMNVMYIKNKKPSETDSYTEKLGVNQCVIAAQNAVLDEFQTKIDEGIIEQVIRFGAADIAPKYLDCVTKTARDYCGKIFNTLEKYEYNSELIRLWIVGGGGCIIKNFGKFDKERVTIIDDICASAKGYEMLTYRILKAGERS